MAASSLQSCISLSLFNDLKPMWSVNPRWFRAFLAAEFRFSGVDRVLNRSGIFSLEVCMGSSCSSSSVTVFLYKSCDLLHAGLLCFSFSGTEILPLLTRFVFVSEALTGFFSFLFFNRWENVDFVQSDCSYDHGIASLGVWRVYYLKAF